MFDRQESRRVACVLLVIAALLGAADQARAEICLGAIVRFTDGAPSAPLLKTMEKEVSSIWSPYGVRIAWSSDSVSGACEGVDGSFEVVVERHVLSLSVKSENAVLGSTHLQLASIDRCPIHIDYDA